MAELSGGAPNLLRTPLPASSSSSTHRWDKAKSHYRHPLSGRNANPDYVSMVQVSLLALPRRLLPHLFAVLGSRHDHSELDGLFTLCRRAGSESLGARSVNSLAHWHSSFAVRRDAESYQFGTKSCRDSLFIFVWHGPGRWAVSETPKAGGISDCRLGGH